MNRKQLRAKKAFERKHALKIARQYASSCYDLDSEGNYAQITNPTAVQTLRKAFERYLLLQDDITFMQLTDEQSEAFLASGELVNGTVSVMAVTRDKKGDLVYAIERCSGSSKDWGDLQAEAMLAAGRSVAYFQKLI